MPHDDETKAFDDSGGGGGSTTADQEEDDDPFGGGFDLEDDGTISSDGESVEPADDTGGMGGTSTGRDDDDDDDRGGGGGSRAPGPVDSDRDVGGTASPEARSKVGTSPSDRGDGTGGPEPVPGPVGTGRDDRPSDVSDAEVTQAAASALRRDLRDRYPDARDIDITQSGPGIFAVSVDREDYYDRSGVIRTDENQFRGRLMAQEARVERETGRDVDLVEAPAGGLKFVFRDEDPQPTVDDLGPFTQAGVTEETPGGTRVIGAEPESGGPGFRIRRLPPQRQRRPMGELIRGPSGERAPSTPMERLDMQVDARVGMDLQRGEDYTVDRTVTEEGRVRYDARLTEEGRRELRGDEFEVGAAIPVPWFVNHGGEPTGVPGFVESDVGEAEARAAQRTIRGAAEAGAEAVAPFSPLVMTERAGAAAERAAERPAGERPDLLEFGRSLFEEPDQEGPAERQAEALVGGGLTAVATAPINIGLTAEELREFGIETERRYREEGAGVGARPLDERGSPAQPRLLEFGGAAEFAAEETGETAGQVAARVGEQLAKPTGRAQLAGSLLFTAGAMGAAGAVSKTAGAATRFAIQPGEELATAGLSRAAPGVASRFPGGRIDWEEPLVYGGIAAARQTRRAGARARAAGARAAGGVAARTPRIRLERSQGAGLIDVDPALGFQARRAASELRPGRPDIRGRVGAATERTRAALQSADVSAEARLRGARERVTDFSAPSFDVRGRAATARERATGAAQRADAEAEAALYGLRGRLSPDFQRPSLGLAGRAEAARGRALGLDVDAEAALYGLRRRAAGLEAPSVDIRSPFESAAERARWAAISTDVRAQERLYGARRRFGRLSAPDISGGLVDVRAGIVGAAQRADVRAETALYNARTGLAEFPGRMRSGAGAIAGVRDLTLRVEAREPVRLRVAEPTTEARETDPSEGVLEFDDELPGGEVEDEPGGEAVSQAEPGGTGGRYTGTGVEYDLAVESEVETEPEADATPTTLRTELTNQANESLSFGPSEFDQGQSGGTVQTLRDQLSDRTGPEQRAMAATQASVGETGVGQAEGETETTAQTPGFELEQAFELRAPPMLEFRPPEVETETPPIEFGLPKAGAPFTPMRLSMGRSPEPSPPSRGPGVIETGWLRETFADIATGGSLAFFGLEPSQEALRRAPWRQRLTGSLPTGVELYGTPSQKAAIADVRAFFTSRPGAKADTFDTAFDADFNLSL